MDASKALELVTPGRIAALLLVLGGSLALALWLLRGLSSEGPPRGRNLSFRLEDLGGFAFWRLALVSVFGLFLELLLIRWISSEIRIFAYFKNFVLVACFLGFGLGGFLCRRPVRLATLLLPLLALTLLIQVPWPDLRFVVGRLPALIGATSEVDMWGVPNLPGSMVDWIAFGVALIAVVPLFTLLSLAFVPIGQVIGGLLERPESGIRGYSVNILASLAGILLYTLMCLGSTPPPAWFAVAGALAIVLFWRRPSARWATVLTFVACAALAAIGPRDGSSVYWSPYQKLQIRPVLDSGTGETLSISLETNGSWYQQVLDLSPGFVAAHPWLFEGEPVEWNAYNVPYRLAPEARSVLVLGAGMGNDVAAALRNGAERVVAVEIDPLILRLGREMHFEKPYDSPRVEQVVDDARSYVETSQERFDLVLYSLLDSHATSSHYSNIRIDNFVYTVEAMTAARDLLAPGGLFVVKFQAETAWVDGRLQALLEQVFDHPPVRFTARGVYTTGGNFFVTGEPARLARLAADPVAASFLREHATPPPPAVRLTTDDWPYFYQHEPGLPAAVLGVSGVLLAACWLLFRQTGAAAGGLRWHFVFLGAGFMLLEAQIVSRLALLFGTTWIVNSIAISGLLLLVFAANCVVEAWPRLPVRFAYAGIAVSLALSFFVPLELLFFESPWWRVVAALVVLCTPVFFTGIVFITSFARSSFSGAALGSNLLGALFGGMLESLSLWTGLRSLVLVAMAAYLLAFLARADREDASVPLTGAAPA